MGESALCGFEEAHLEYLLFVGTIGYVDRGIFCCDYRGTDNDGYIKMVA
jgi:hypothetical protein